MYGLTDHINYAGPDGLEAWALDSGLAYRYDALEQEEKQSIIVSLRNEMRGIMRSMGNKQADRIKWQPSLGKTTDEDMKPKSNNNIFSFVGRNTTVERIEKEK